MFKIAGIRKYNFKHLKRCTTAGEILNPDINKLWNQNTGLCVHEGFRQTKSIRCIYVPEDDNAPENSLGKFEQIYDLRLIKEDGEFAKPGDV
ncbi:MAG: hypothetical protein HUJ51_01855 [Eggerthellaceae bacterium]|nr:hypothetical protein [Eggerthellaceae bacterium]